MSTAQSILGGTAVIISGAIAIGGGLLVSYTAYENVMYRGGLWDHLREAKVFKSALGLIGTLGLVFSAWKLFDTTVVLFSTGVTLGSKAAFVAAANPFGLALIGIVATLFALTLEKKLMK